MPVIDEYEDKKISLIDCVGIDNLIHVCEPHEDKAVCGTKIKYKKLERDDRRKRYCCYECTY